VRDVPGGEERWQVLPEGIIRVIVNGETIVENGRLTGAKPGRTLHIGNPLA
jgi:N-acyl-D-aspartate/D-glutamate deacylase